MDTLINLRCNERVVEHEGLIDDKSKIAYVTVELQKRDGAILVFRNHSDDIVDIVLGGVDPKDSGYLFFASELQIDPVNSCMVHKHRLATAGEINELKDKHIPLDKLPVLVMLDPIRRWHNFSVGSIVAIERPGGLYFRLVD